ncbi:universal stress protein [Desulfoluna butyratoxydans]|uniref:Uspa n=1 Tax=Desulfoluna butyratoxydans TaxID=231438 RepID=A0A4U8YTF8_9BACT|nr:universal stress protein [Desulfoluna butyratoxydans]VFQ47231.1 uspa [Desulfoluna butyratoxydans]
MNDLHQRVLIPVDGSIQSTHAALYAARILIPEKTTFTLFLVENVVPETFWDNQSDGMEGPSPDKLGGWWEENHIRYNRKVIEKIRTDLIKEGFSDESVEVKIRPRRVGIARDIIRESKKGYDLVVAGRIGHNIHTGAILGNCARKLIASVNHVPLVIVGGNPDSTGVLIGFDASEGSKNCVRQLKKSVTRNIEKVKICYVSRSLNLMSGSFDPFQASLDAYNLMEQEHQIHHQSRMRPHLQKAETILRDAGFDRAGVDSIILRSYLSRSEGLMDEAKKSGYDTVMVGRRGHSIVEDFLLGRVGDKLVQMGQDRAIWLVN